MPVLTDTEVKQSLGKLKGWKQNGQAIQRVFEFPDFKAAMAWTAARAPAMVV